MATAQHPALSAQDSSASQTFANLGAVCVVLWLAAGLPAAGGASCSETCHAAVVLAAAAGGLFFWRGAARMAASAAGRLWAVGMFVAGTMAVSPAFQYSVSQRGMLRGATLASATTAAAAAMAVLLWLAWRACGEIRGHVGRLTCPRISPGAARLEAFLVTPAARAHIAAVGVLLVAVDVALSGLPAAAILPRAGLLVVTVLCLPALLQLAAAPAGQRALHAALVAALSLSVAVGVARYAGLRSTADSIRVLLDQNRQAEAQTAYSKAAALNDVLRARGVSTDIETQWGLYWERKGAYEDALVHWRRVAEQRGVDPTEMAPIRRILCKMGDSLNAWRRLVYQGFPAIADPELAPGILALGDIPGSDVRAKLLAALLAWEQHAPPEELKRRLAEVRKVCPNEPSACNLLRRLEQKAPDNALWLPGEMIVGRKLTSQSGLGSIEELGEVTTLVVLNEGHWEVGLIARGTPLHEEWPVIRVEFNGKEIARTQVNRSGDYETPFTLDVNRGNIYRVRIVFENRLEEMVQGRVARRGLVINGMNFRRAQE